jgi:hypothetical protein
VAGPELDAGRARIVERGLVGEAVASLTPVVSGLSLDGLGAVKQLLKRFFSDAPWTDADDEALASALADVTSSGVVGGRAELGPGVVLVWGTEGGAFRLRVEPADPSVGAAGARAAPQPADDLSELFDGPVVPEATPSPRTVRFATPQLHTGPSRAYRGVDGAADDPRVASILTQFGEVTDVLVGPDFVAVTIVHAEDWDRLLAPLLAAVTEGFTGDATEDGSAASVRAIRPAAATPDPPVSLELRWGRDEGGHAPRRLERAWIELGGLRPERPEDLDRVLAASRDEEPARRQVAAVLLRDAHPRAAGRAWRRLIGDSSRAVRRSVVDTAGDVGREDLRDLLVGALDDADAWVRWKALRGIAGLGAAPSRGAIEARLDDPDFRVRLEAARVLAAGD